MRVFRQHITSAALRDQLSKQGLTSALTDRWKQDFASHQRVRRYLRYSSSLDTELVLQGTAAVFPKIDHVACLELQPHSQSVTMATMCPTRNKAEKLEALSQPHQAVQVKELDAQEASPKLGF